MEHAMMQRQLPVTVTREPFQCIKFLSGLESSGLEKQSHSKFEWFLFFLCQLNRTRNFFSLEIDISICDAIDD